ncbi:MAG TPA: tetratricopeptide repeat protein [Pirellulaceae bacterium]|jgi:predicted O-linked N-acetylglucosamine transferase (SPINDLY family)
MLRHWDEAAIDYRQTLALDPTIAAAWTNLGAIEHNRGQLNEAKECYERSLSLEPGNFDALSNYARLLCDLGQPSLALELVPKICGSQGHILDALRVQGRACLLLMNYAGAELAYRQAIQLDPKHSQSIHNLATALYQQGKLTESEAVIRTLVTATPEDAEAWSLWGWTLIASARANEGAAAIRRSVELAPQSPRHSNFLVALQYTSDITPENLLREHQRWYSTYVGATKAITARPMRREAGAPLRLGFVSDGFGRGPTGAMVLPVLEALEKSACTVVCYSDGFVDDEYTARFRQRADIWREAQAFRTEFLVKAIREDEIDVLFDLTGHTGNCLPTFNQKPAPIQVSWFGYVGTTGLREMDYLLADRFHVQPGEENWYSEKVLRMPNGYACFGPPKYAPAVGALPALNSDGVTFGCFNAPAKFNPQILDAWSSILAQQPNSRLFLKFRGLDDSGLQARLSGEFAQRGIAPGRLLFEGNSPHAELLACYNRVDIALDTQPYSGGVTTCEALWMGVPVITFPGKTFAGRHSLSHLTNAGFSQFVADDLSGYVNLAVDWAKRLDELAMIRSQMRDQVRQSPLCDAPRFARDFLAVLKGAWNSRFGAST